MSSRNSRMVYITERSIYLKGKVYNKSLTVNTLSSSPRVFARLGPTPFRNFMSWFNISATTFFAHRKRRRSRNHHPFSDILNNFCRHKLRCNGKGKFNGGTRAVAGDDLPIFLNGISCHICSNQIFFKSWIAGDTLVFSNSICPSTIGAAQMAAKSFPLL